MFSWMDWLVIKSRIKEIQHDDLSLEPQDTCPVAKAKFLTQWEKSTNSCRPSLVWTLLRCFFWDFFVAGLYKFIWSVLICLCAFYFVRELTAFVGDQEVEIWHGWVLCVGFLFGCLVLSFTFQQMSAKATQVGLRMRAALLSAVYEKSLRLDLQDLNAGDVVNLATNDCSRLMESVLSFHYLWSGALEALGIVGLLIYLVGNVGYLALGIILILIVVQCFFGYIVAGLRSKSIDTTDARVSTMTEILMAIKLVKLYAWEDFFAKQVKKIRRKEVMLMSGGATIKTINLMIVYGVPPLIALGIFGLYVSIVGKLSPAVAFTTLSLFNTLRFPLVVIPKALRGFAEFIAALSRLQKFLLKPEMEVHPKDPMYKGVQMQNASFSYLGTETLLHNMSFEIGAGQLCGMVGLVGTGKSNLVYAILGQMKLTNGDYKVGGAIGYVPQTPWIQNGTVRDNILFGLPYDEKKYKQTVFACCLERDFEIMEPHGDLTYLSDRGQNLSGGQKQRIALARATYADADMYILDSPLSAVDQHTAKHIFEHCIRGMLKSKACLLITHHLELLPECDLVSVMNNGRMEYFGDWNNECLATVQKFFPNWQYERDEKQPTRRLSLQIHSPVIEIEENTIVHLAHQSRHHKEEQKEIAHDDAIILKDEIGDVGMERTASTTSIDNLVDVVDVEVTPTTPDTAAASPPVEEDNMPRSKVPFAGHLIWIYESNAFVAFLSLSIFALAQVTRIISDRWIGWWTADKFKLVENDYIWIYAVLVAAFIVLLIIRGALFYGMVLRMTTRLHNKMFKKVLRAPMLFFNDTPVGRVLNSFSKDQDCADEGLADTIHTTLIYLMILLTSIIIVCTSLPYYTIVLAVLVVSFFVMYFLYSAPAQYLKDQSGLTNAEIFAHLNESLTGLAVIRAFEREGQFKKQTVQKIDSNHKIVFNGEMLQLWLSFRLDFISSILVFVTAIFAVAARGSVDASSFGLAISNSFQQLVFFTWVVRGFAEINGQIACMERINFYAKKTETEAPAHIKKTEPPSDWPTHGVVEITDLVLRYSPKLPPVLKGVSLKINGGEKIGVVGRTGSGKTTLLMTLFRLIEPDSGKIVIDGIDIGPMGLTDLRRKIAIIPQEPVLFRGTLRSNLDPFGQYSDKELWNAIECANLKTEIDAMPLKLETPVLEGGSNYSLGQKQLFCLARAVLNQSKLLVFDEATAAMDLETDAQIQATIRRVFADRTILTIAHRLDTIIDSDRILVMDAGKVIEFDTPATLLSNPVGSFTSLVDQTGPESATSLRRIAFNKQAKQNGTEQNTANQ